MPSGVNYSSGQVLSCHPNQINNYICRYAHQKAASINYLAHAYLSFEHPGILAGNMISDYVKGKKRFDYPADIQRGITLHRAIDRFTDEHPATREAKEVFRPVYRLYSGAFVDVVYDHFLARDPGEFSGESLFRFSQWVYRELENQSAWFPPRFGYLFPYMKTHNWLYHYQTVAGTEKSLDGVVRRSAYLRDSGPAAELFEKHYQLLEQCYRPFWADLKPFARDRFGELMTDGSI